MANPTATRTAGSQLLVMLAAVACGMVVWLLVQLNERADLELEVNVRVTGVDPRVELNVLPSQVRVRFSYLRVQSELMNSANFFVRAEEPPNLIARLSDSLSGEGTLPLSLGMVEGRGEAMDLERANITPTAIEPSQVTWTARLRALPAVIVPTVVGEPADGYRFEPGSAVVESNAETMVLLTAAKEQELRVAGIDRLELPTEPVDIGGRAGSVREEVSVLLEEGMSMLDPEDTLRRTVALRISEEIQQRIVRDIPIEYRPTRGNLKSTVEPPLLDVRLEAPRSVLERVRPADIRFTLIDMVERAGTTREVAVKARIEDPALANGILSAEAIPGSVRVTLENLTPDTTPTTNSASPSQPSLATDDQPTS